jgi:hypothetical protein
VPRCPKRSTPTRHDNSERGRPRGERSSPNPRIGSKTTLENTERRHEKERNPSDSEAAHSRILAGVVETSMREVAFTGA